MAAMAGEQLSEIVELGMVPELRAAVQRDIEAYAANTGHELPDDVQSDMRLARFINAHDHDLNAAAAAYRKMLEWRRTAEVEQMRKDLMPELDQLRQSAFPHWEKVREVGEFGPWYHSGECHKGDLVHLEVIGRLDPSLLLEKVTAERILQHQIGFFEARARVLDTLSEKEGRLVRTVQVRDLSKFGLHLLKHARAMSTVSAIMKTGSHNFPESTRKSIFICTPMSFYAVWQTVSVVLRKKTQEKVMFLKHDYHRELLKYVNARAIHRLEKMKAAANHEFIYKGDAEDHLPLVYAKDVVVPAGKKEYYPIWLERSGPRSKVVLTLSPPSPEAQVPAFTLAFVTSKRPEAGDEGVLVELALTPVPREGESLTWEVSFPAEEVDDQEIDSGFLLLTFDNTASWVYSVTVPLKATFEGVAGAENTSSADAQAAPKAESVPAPASAPAPPSETSAGGAVEPPSQEALDFAS